MARGNTDTAPTLTALDGGAGTGSEPDPFEGEPFPASPAEDDRLLPEGFDLFELRPDLLKKKQDAGVDCRLASVRVFPVVNGVRVNAICTFPAHGANARWFAATFPPGVYDLAGLNAQGVYIGGRRHKQPGTGSPVSPAPSPFGTGASWGAPPQPSAGSIADQVMQVALQRMLAPAESPLADVVKAITAQSALMAQSVQLQLQMMQTAQQLQNNSPAAKAESTLLEWMREESKRNADMVKALADRKPAIAPTAGKGDLEQLLKLVQFGMSLRDGKPPNDTGDGDDKGRWVELVVGLADALGPGVLAIVAQALPPEKAQLICQIVEEHQRARAAEANADANVPIDTEGHAA